jgi:hypothetical protein
MERYVVQFRGFFNWYTGSAELRLAGFVWMAPNNQKRGCLRIHRMLMC